MIWLIYKRKHVFLCNLGSERIISESDDVGHNYVPQGTKKCEEREYYIRILFHTLCYVNEQYNFSQMKTWVIIPGLRTYIH